jgi:hypothetical protein
VKSEPAKPASLFDTPTPAEAAPTEEADANEEDEILAELEDEEEDELTEAA